MSGHLRPAPVAVLVAALSLSACAQAERERCTQADLDRPAPRGMPAPVRVAEARRLNDEPFEPLPATVTPRVGATQAWRRLRGVRARSGGGTDELLLGVFAAPTGRRVPSWALYTTHLAAPLAPYKAPPGVTALPDADACVFVDVLAVLDADTGEPFSFKTVTSTVRRRPSPPPTERPREPEPEPTLPSPPD